MAPPPKQLVLAASSADAGVASWDLRTGAEEIRHRPCASRPRALASVAGRFLAAAQAPQSGGNSGTIHFYHWDKVSGLRAEPPPNGALTLRSLTTGSFFFFWF
jgi:pre-rRNA-processing protein IPI3